MTVTRSPACRIKFCPAPKDPDFHRCFVCQALEIEHHDAGGGGMGGGGGHHTKPENVVALCHTHHEAVTRHEHSDRILDLPGRGRCYVYYDVRGNILCDRVLEAESSAAEAGKQWGSRLAGRRKPSTGVEATDKRLAPTKAFGDDERPEGDNAGSSSREVLPVIGDSSAAEPLSSVAEPLDRGAHPISARDSRLVPSPSATPPSVFNKDSWCREGMQLVYWYIAVRDARDEVRFKIGDWFNEGEGILSDEAFGYLRGFEEVTVRQYSWVAGRVNPDTRVSTLPWTCHRAVAALPEPEQKEWLEKAKEENLSSKGLYRAIHGERVGPTYRCPSCGTEGALSEFRRT